MSDILEQPVVLRAVTLRGIGSYLHGARLELRPFTVLCGTNGSGKSTWLNVLNRLAKANEDAMFPLRMPVEPAGGFYVTDTNAFYFNSATEDVIPQLNQQDLEYGTPGTIGLELKAVVSLALTLPRHYANEDATSIPQSFLWRGECPGGTDIRIRLAHPDTAGKGSNNLFDAHDLIEIELNHSHKLSLTRPKNRSKYFRLKCASAFLPNTLHTNRNGPIVAKIAISKVRDRAGFNIDVIKSEWPDDLISKIAENLIQLVRELTRIVFSGYFYISAIRTPHTYSRLSQLSEDVRSKENRYLTKRWVGGNGEGTWLLERNYAFNLLRENNPPFTGRIDQQFVPSQIDDVAIVPNPTTKYIFSRASKKVVDSFSRSLVRYQEHERHMQKHIDDLAAWIAEDEALLNRVRQQLAAICNEVLPLRDLYRAEFWPTLDKEGVILLGKGIENLSEDEVKRLNRVLITIAFGDKNVRPASYYVVETFVDYWSRRFFNTEILGPEGFDLTCERSLGAAWADDANGPTGFLIHNGPLPTLGEPPVYNDLMDIFCHSCMGKGSSHRHTAQRLSAGFHQVMPMVVQAALMHRHELMAIENPEVHLHPALQIDVAEFLIRQAMAGKHVIVETHSDLIVRRILRAFLEEEVSQQMIRIYFADITKVHASSANCYTPASEYNYSTLLPLCTNEQGQIANWPEGFLDDDLKESRRLMNIMYQVPVEDEGGDE